MSVQNWSTYSLEVADQNFPFASFADALAEAKLAEAGHLYVQATDGRNLAFWFDASRSFFLYMGSDKVDLRPHFPARPDVEAELRDVFCKSCGILLIRFRELVAFGMERREGFRLCEEVLRTGELPASIPPPATPQTHLPGMEEYTEFEQAWRAIEWRPFPPP